MSQEIFSPDISLIFINATTKWENALFEDILGTSNTYNFCTRWFRRSGVTDACHSLLCCMDWAKTVFRYMYRLLGWLVAKLGASFISLSANALLGLCCKEAIYFGEKMPLVINFYKNEINKLWFWKLTFGWILLPILLGLGMLMDLPEPDGICRDWLVWMEPEFVGPPSSDWRPKAWRKFM